MRKRALRITSGLGGTYPPGYPVGVISKIDIKPGEQFAEIEATPAAALNRSRVVLLVWPGTQLEQTAGDDTETTAEATAGDEAETTPAEQAEEPGQ